MQGVCMWGVWVCVTLSVLVWTSQASAAGHALPKPAGKVIMTVSGAISQTNLSGGAAFDLPMLEALPQHDIQTSVPWLDGKFVFTGPRVMDVLNRLGYEGSSLKARALDGYSVEIPIEDMDRFQTIFAIKKDGKKMRIRERGPVWIMYPFDAHPELQQEVFFRRSIWQITEIQVQ